MIIIFIGAIGGLLTSGIVGLFVGAVVLALGYTLFLAWLQGGSVAAPAPHVPEERAPASPPASPEAAAETPASDRPA